MSDVQWLFVVLAVLYLWECACWLRRGSVAFSTWFGRRWGILHPGTLLGNQRGGFVFAAPLPPLGNLLTAAQLPLSISPDGVLACVATNVNPGWRPAASNVFLRFEEIREVAARGKKLLVNRENFLVTGSGRLARLFAGELRRFAKLDAVQRKAAIGEFIDATLDSKTVRERWQELQKVSRPVQLLANALFVYLFLFAPALIWQLGFKLSWLGLLVGLFALTVTTGIFFYRAHRKLFPAAEDERFTHTLTVMLAPMTTMRAHDALSRHLFEIFHPLVIAKMFLIPDDFLGFARRALLDLRYPAEPVCANADSVARSTELFARTALRSAVEKFLKDSGVEPDELCWPPKPMDESCSAYCPRCEAQFTTTAATCLDCGGLAVAAFESQRG